MAETFAEKFHQKRRRHPITLGVVTGLILSLFISPTALAAFPNVNQSNGINSGGSVTLPMPVGITAGDLLIAVFNFQFDVGSSCPSEEPEWSSISGDSGSRTFACAKIAEGDETSFVFTSGVAGFSSSQSYRVVGWFGGSVGSGALSWNLSEAQGATPNPPPHNPLGWDIEETLWLTGGFIANNGQACDITASPAGFTDIRYEDGPQTSLRSAQRKEASASIDPGAFTVTPACGSSGAASWTISIRPSATEPLVTLAATNVRHDRSDMNGRLDVLFSASVELWFDYGLAADELTEESSHIFADSTGTFSIRVNGLESETTYFFRAQSLEAPGGYNATGEILSFTTTERPTEDLVNILYIVVFISLCVFFLVFCYIVKKKRDGGGLFGRFR